MEACFKLVRGLHLLLLGRRQAAALNMDEQLRDFVHGGGALEVRVEQWRPFETALLLRLDVWPVVPESAGCHAA